jgi:uncharacterized protein (TIGR03086 family)
MDAATLFDRACATFDARVRSIRPDQWAAATPCSEWNVRDLVNHVTVEDLWVPALLAGKTIDEVGDAYDGDQLGDSPLAVWAEAAAAAREAAGEPAVESRTVHLSYGDETAREYLMQIFADNLIHAWDLASATGGDTGLPPDLVDACAAWFAEREQMYREMGAIGPRITTSVADNQAGLLAAFGRLAA